MVAPDGFYDSANADTRLDQHATLSRARGGRIAGRLHGGYAAPEAAHVRLKGRRIATDLQDTLQPPSPEHVPGLAVASYVRPVLDEASAGGDFYDVFLLDKEIYAIVIGDMSGKGLDSVALYRRSFGVWTQPQRHAGSRGLGPRLRNRRRS